MSVRATGLWLVLLIVIAAAATYWYKTQLVWQEEIVDFDPSPEARQHQMLAAKRYLKHFGYTVKNFESRDFFSKLPPTSDTIIAQQIPDNLRTETYQNLLQWISDGGQLVTWVTSQHNSDNHNKLSETLQLRIHYDENKHNEYLKLQVETELSTDPVNIEIYVPLEFNLPENTSVVASAGTATGLAFAQYKQGKGLITLSVDTELWNNNYIGDDDNARLLSLIMAERIDKGTIHLNDSMINTTGVFLLIWHKLKWLCILAFILALSLLRRAWVRFGPLQKLPDNRSNNFARHLHAVAAYLFHHGCSDQILKPVQSELQTRFTVKKQHDITQQQADTLSRAARATGLQTALLEKALYSESPSTHTLITITRTLQVMQRAARKE